MEAVIDQLLDSWTLMNLVLAEQEKMDDSRVNNKTKRAELDKKYAAYSKEHEECREIIMNALKGRKKNTK